MDAAVRAVAPAAPARRARRRGIVALLAALLAVPAGLVAGREPALRTVGGALVAADPVAAADVVVVPADTGPAGVLEAADLVHAGVAPAAAVFADPPNAVDREFLRRGVPYEDLAARSIRQLRALGVTRVEVIPRGVAGSEDAGRVLPAWCAERGLRSVIVVTTSDHSRRLRRLLRRAMAGQATQLTVRPARYSEFDPDRWWHTREGVRTGVIELQKLALDLVRHPLS
jgi:hypothetical protein